MAMEKTFNAAEAETRIYSEWEEAGHFKAGANAAKDAKSFSIVIPPPNVTGSLHMGHALNNTLQDILIRWKRMQGYDVLWQPGTDHAGIATQMVVERKLAAEGQPSRRDMGRKAFVDKIWEWKEESGGTITNQLRRLGASCDWSRERFTMDEGLSKAVLEVFVSLYKDGLIYKDKRLVNWDPHFETAISDLEVEQVEQDGKLWRFKYPLADGSGHVVVATTRPETMLGDTGVAVHPEDPRYLDYIGKEIILPLVGRSIPIVVDEYADPETGSGAVKITPAHDFNDFQIGKRCNLRTINIMDSKANLMLAGNEMFLEAVPESDDLTEVLSLDGMSREDARNKVIEMMEARGLLDGIDQHPNKVPHGDRSKVVIEPYLTDQWFVDAETLAKPAIEAVQSGETKFVPSNWDKTYYQWMNNIEPWCISRQLWWGHQVPVWYGPDGTEFCEKSEAEAITAAKAHYGKATELTRDTDVLDTWFSSALWAFSTLGWPENTKELEKYYKTDVLITGFDIIFFWVARMMMAGLHYMKDEDAKPEVPFHTVYVHALVRDEQGQKMSKSKGNVLDPLILIDQYGADAVRFTLTAMAAMGRDLKLSTSRIEGYRNFGTKLWNAARFCEMNECQTIEGLDYSKVKNPVNKWIVNETIRTKAALETALDSYRFNDAANILYAHTWGIFCDWYLELSKPMLQGDDADQKAESQATVAWALDQILLLLHPIMPFITEELWRVTGSTGTKRDKPLIHGAWPQYSDEAIDSDADEQINWAIKLIEAVRSVRTEVNVPPSAKIPMVLINTSADAQSNFEQTSDLILRLARISECTMADKAPDGSISVAVEGATACILVADAIDAKAEVARLQKSMDKLTKESDSLHAKLSNEAFIAKAPSHVVETQRTRVAEIAETMAKLEEAANRMRALQ